MGNFANAGDAGRDINFFDMSNSTGVSLYQLTNDDLAFEKAHTIRVRGALLTARWRKAAIALIAAALAVVAAVLFYRTSGERIDVPVVISMGAAVISAIAGLSFGRHPHGDEIRQRQKFEVIRQIEVDRGLRRR